MKILISVFTIFCLFFFNSCKSDSAGSGGGFGVDPGGGGGGGVTFGITVGPGNISANNKIFYGTPSTAVVVTNVNVSVAAAQYNHDFQGDGTTVYPANQPVSINEFSGVAPGQVWVFVFTGKLGSATGTAFSVSSTYTVQ
jgi:hypothetical protein